MSEISTKHDTVVVQRVFEASARQVFAAWTDPDSLSRWYVPGDETWAAKILAHEPRVGGVKRIRFGPREGAQYTEECHYEDIVPERRLCFSMTISHDDRRITTSMVTVELREIGARTETKVTDQMVILDGGDTAPDRERGWGETLDKLPNELRRAAH
jgi:uncharacterized protein YndB with AHSA1/START domain